MIEAKAIIEAVGVVLIEAESRATERFETFRAECLERMADFVGGLPEPEAGRDGVDRILALPRYVRPGETCEANCIAWANAGIWQSVRVTSGGPADDPSGWKCLVPGVAAIETREDWRAREIVIGLRMSDGALHECRGRMPATRLPPDFLQRGWGVLAGDTVRPPGEDIELMALRDGAALGTPEDWQETRLRGFRGQIGKPGPGLAGLALVEDPAIGLAIVPRYQDPAVKGEPIAVDLLTGDPAPGIAPIVGYAGAWNAGRSYRRGEAVTAEIDGQRRLALSIKPDNDAWPEDAGAWLVML